MQINQIEIIVSCCPSTVLKTFLSNSLYYERTNAIKTTIKIHFINNLCCVYIVVFSDWYTQLFAFLFFLQLCEHIPANLSLVLHLLEFSLDKYYLYIIWQLH